MWAPFLNKNLDQGEGTPGTVSKAKPSCLGNSFKNQTRCREHTTLNFKDTGAFVWKMQGVTHSRPMSEIEPRGDRHKEADFNSIEDIFKTGELIQARTWKWWCPREVHLSMAGNSVEEL